MSTSLGTMAISEERRNQLKMLAKQKVAKLLSEPQQSLPIDESAGPPPQLTGPRGGRYTIGTTRDGRPYRRCF